jgi:hypothetical protein
LRHENPAFPIFLILILSQILPDILVYRKFKKMSTRSGGSFCVHSAFNLRPVAADKNLLKNMQNAAILLIGCLLAPLPDSKFVKTMNGAGLRI